MCPIAGKSQPQLRLTLDTAKLVPNDVAMTKAQDKARALALDERWLQFTTSAAGAEKVQAANASELAKLITYAITALGTLSLREQRVLRLRYGLNDDDTRPRTLEEVGAEFNLTRERIRQIEAKALRKLRFPRNWDPDWKPEFGPDKFGTDGELIENK